MSAVGRVVRVFFLVAALALQLASSEDTGDTDHTEDTDAEAKGMLEQMDADKDGKLSLAEIITSVKEAQKEHSDAEAAEEMDKEIEDNLANLETHFGPSDSDGDGLLDITELSALIEAFQSDEEDKSKEAEGIDDTEDAEDTDESDGTDNAEEAEETEDTETEDTEETEDTDDTEADTKELLQKIDSDKDGKLSLAEITAYVEEVEKELGTEGVKKSNDKIKTHFGPSDNNGDGFLDVTELPALIEAFQRDDEDQSEM